MHISKQWKVVSVSLPAVLLLAPGLSLQKYILEKYESQAFCCLVSI